LSQSQSATDAPHYGGPDHPFEAIKVIEAWRLGFCLGNTIKYISRAGKKPGESELKDLKKALWYLSRHVRSLELTPNHIPCINCRETIREDQRCTNCGLIGCLRCHGCCEAHTPEGI
jgi:hypothetical protein